MVCRKCGNPLRQVKGGPNQERFVHVTILGCLNDECELKMIEQDRTEVPLVNFTE